MVAMGHITTYSLTATTDGVIWSAACPGRYTPYGWPGPQIFESSKKIPPFSLGEKSCPGIEHPSVAWSMKQF
jgi:hypothetical protein